MEFFFRILTLPITLPVMFVGYHVGQIIESARCGWKASDIRYR